MAYVDVCIANDEDFESSLGIPAYDGDMSRGIEQIKSYKEGMLEIQKQFPNCKAVASVLRNLYTVEDGDWMGIYLKDGKFYESPVHRLCDFRKCLKADDPARCQCGERNRDRADHEAGRNESAEIG